MNPRPFISVVMVVYNAAAFVAEAVDSILNQTYDNFEFVIVDGGSVDGSVDVIRELAPSDPRIRTLFLPDCGASTALNAGVALTQGEFIAHMEPDDIAVPERFAIQLDYIRQTGVDVCGGCLKKFGNTEGILWFPEHHEDIVYELLFRAAMIPTTVMIRAEILKAHPYDESAVFQDYELWTRLALHCRMGNVQQVLGKYRRHDQQTSVVRKNRVRTDFKRYRKRYFHDLFPKETEASCAALVRAADHMPCEDLAQLDLGGLWLLKLAALMASSERPRLVNRWWQACKASSNLGLNTFRAYRRVAQDLGTVSLKMRLILWLVCALRLKKASGLERSLKWVYRRLPV